MQRALFLLVCWLVSTISGWSQQEYLDSLRRAYTQEKDPARKIDIFYDIANERSLDNPQLGFAYADSLEQMAQKARYKKGLAMSRHLRGFAFDDQGEYRKALQLFQEELAIFQELEDERAESGAYTNLGGVWDNLGKRDSAVVYYLKALAIDEMRGDSLGQSIVHNNIGNIYSDEGSFDKAIDHFAKALKIRQQMGAEKRYLQCYSNLATVYSRMNNYAKAEEYGLKGLEYAIKYDNKAWAGIITNSLGANCNDQKLYREAIPWVEKAVAYWTAIGNEVYLTYAFYNLTIAYSGLQDGGKALQYAHEGYAIVEKLKLDSQKELYYKAFAGAYEANGDLRKAFDWYRRYVAIADSLFKLDNAQKVARLETEYETEKKENQINRQQLELEKQANQKNRILFSSIAVILLLIGLFQYFRSRQKIRQKEAELNARLEQNKAEKLQEMDHLKSVFFANISHEFRTPLTLIMSPVEQMISGTFRGNLQEYYRIIHHNAGRLLRLVNQLLELSKLESGKLELEASEGDLGRLVRAAAGSFESLAVRKRIALEVYVPDAPIFCFFDVDKVEKILTNLISNAFKFTNEGGRVSIRLSVEYYGEEKAFPSDVHLAIKDTGVGISAEQLPYLFERFTKSAVSEVQLGSGIGLALTKELIELHGGTIQVESSVGEGTVFTLSLRVDRAFFPDGAIAPDKGQAISAVAAGNLPNPDITISPSNPPSMVGMMTLDKPVLLIAEDNPDVRFYITDTLRQDYKILEAENGRAALKKALQSTPDLVITDIMMPEMDGLEFCRQLKNNEKTSHIPIVMLTARADQADKMEGLEKGADDYLLKPFDARELQVRVANLIEQRHRLQTYYRQALHTFSTTPVEAESMDSAFLRRVRDAVEAKMEDEDFSVSELGRQIGMSRSQLHRKLSALTGYSPNEIIRNMRLERARELLEKEAGTVSEIAYRCGFQSPAYFIKCFKDYYGITPGEIN